MARPSAVSPGRVWGLLERDRLVATRCQAPARFVNCARNACVAWTRRDPLLLVELGLRCVRVEAERLGRGYSVEESRVRNPVSVGIDTRSHAIAPLSKLSQTAEGTRGAEPVMTEAFQGQHVSICLRAWAAGIQQLVPAGEGDPDSS
jgi:hypothetical protein